MTGVLLLGVDEEVAMHAQPPLFSFYGHVTAINSVPGQFGGAATFKVDYKLVGKVPDVIEVLRTGYCDAMEFSSDGMIGRGLWMVVEKRNDGFWYQIGGRRN